MIKVNRRKPPPIGWRECGIIGAMSVRLAFGVTTGPGLGCWLPNSGGGATPADVRAGAHSPGTPVAVGPIGAEPGMARAAIRQLTSLVVDGYAAAAGAGVDLGHG